MRKAILMLLLALVAAPAWAEWVKVSETDHAVVYIDTATIKKDGNFRKVWVVTDLKIRGTAGVMSYRDSSEFDCKKERNRILSASMHSEPMLGGKTLFFIDDSSKEWRASRPGTVGGEMLKFVCAK